MSLIKVQGMQAIEDEVLSETIYSLARYSDKHGRDNSLYVKLYNELLGMMKMVVRSENVILPIRVGKDKVVLLELDYKDDGRSYRVSNFFQEKDGDYVELLELTE